MGKLVAGAGQLAPVLTRYLDGRLDRSPTLRCASSAAATAICCARNGLTNATERGSIREVLAGVGGADAAAEGLIGLANANGGPDNITVAIIDVGDPGEAEPPPGTRPAGSRSPGDLAGVRIVGPRATRPTRPAAGPPSFRPDHSG